MVHQSKTGNWTSQEIRAIQAGNWGTATRATITKPHSTHLSSEQQVK